MRRLLNQLLEWMNGFRARAALHFALNNREFQRGLAIMDEIIHKHPAQAHFRATRGEIYLARRMYPEALADLHEAVRLGARNPELIRKCASVAMSLGEQHIAEEVLDVAIRIAIADDQILLERGRLFAAAGQGENAIRCFDHALLLRPTCADAYSLRGGVHLSQGQVEAGQEDLDRALALDPNNYLSLLQKARALQLESNLKEALALYNRAILANPESGEAFRSRGFLHFDEQRYEEARADFSRAVELDAGCMQARLGRSWSLFALEEYEQAVEECHHALAKDSQASEIHLWLAWILATCPSEYIRSGKGAVKHAVLATRDSCSLSTEAQRVLAAAYAEAGMFNEAMALQEQVIQNSPTADLNQDIDVLNRYRDGRTYRI